MPEGEGRILLWERSRLLYLNRRYKVRSFGGKKIRRSYENSVGVMKLRRSYEKENSVGVMH